MAAATATGNELPVALTTCAAEAVRRLRAAPDADVLIRLSVTGAPGCELRLITDQGPAVTAPPLPGAPAAFTNPVWLPVG